jgi:hypothetical protein
MIIIVMQAAAFVLFLWLLRDSPRQPVPQEEREHTNRSAKH